MFRLHKTKPAKSGERIDFKFSNFKALQVPKGWDRLFVSIVSVDTGKTIGKLSKAVVRNGNCQWTDILTESVWIESSKELEDCLFMFVVAMGSARSGILGEAIVNMTDYMSSSTPTPVSFPLKKCNHGTTLQAKIQCMTPVTKLRENGSKETNSKEESLRANSTEMERKSEESDAKSYSSTDLGSTASPYDNGRAQEVSRSKTLLEEVSLSSSGSHHTYDSAEESIGKDSFSPANNVNGEHSPAEPPVLAVPELSASGPFLGMLEAAEETIKDLREEAKKWERDARKLMLEMDILRKEFTYQSKTCTNLEMELSASQAERDALQKEVERLKVLLDTSMVKPAASKNSTFQDEGISHLVKEMESEINFQKENNANLSLQLKRSQDSNFEFLAVLKELEETLEKQKDEIQSLSDAQLQFSNTENSVQVNTEKNRNLMLQKEELQESERQLQAKVHELEEALEDKSRCLKTISDLEMEYKCKLSAKEMEIVSLKGKLSDSMKGKHYPAAMESTCQSNEDLIREIEELRSKLEELENDCQELTDENLELVLKLEENVKNSSRDSLLTNPKSDTSDHEPQMQEFEEKLKKRLLGDIENDFKLSIQELESHKQELEVKVEELIGELGKERVKTERLEAGSLAKEEEIGKLRSCHKELQAKLLFLEKEKSKLEENLEIVTRECDIASKCLNDLQNDLKVLSSSVNSHVSANKRLERKARELESAKHELEHQLMALKQEKEELSTTVTCLEAEIRSLKDERVLARLELEKSKCFIAGLQEETEKLQSKMENQAMNLRQELQEMHNQLSESQVERDYLRRACNELQAAYDSLREECSLLQKLNSELNEEKLEIHKHCTVLEEKLRGSQRCFAESSQRITTLEGNLYSLMEDSASREKSLTAQLDDLLKEKEVLNENFGWLNQKYMDMIVEIENLQEEAKFLSEQLNATKDERDKIASNAANEVTALRAGLAQLESKFNATQIDSEAKIQGLNNELDTSKRNQEILKNDNERMLKLLANYRSSEGKLKNTLNSLELKLTVSEYEKQQLLEESNNLKVQLLKLEALQEEIATLKNELKATKSEKQKIEKSLLVISRECNDLKAEKKSCNEKIATLQKAVSELGDCKKKRVVLEEKLQQMEGELMAKDVLCEQDAEIRTELNRLKRTNKQLQQQIQQIQTEKDKCLKNSQSLEEELILTKEQPQNQRESSGMRSYSRELGKGHNNPGDNHHDAASKIQSLEDELAKAIESNNLQKVQIKRLMSEGRRTRMGSPRKTPAEADVVSKEKFERTKSSLESELKDLRERYLNMSLKYAEVEGEREELVMQLRSASMKRGWIKRTTLTSHNTN